MTEEEEDFNVIEELSGLLDADSKDIKSSLDSYLKQIKSSDVTTANLTAKQVKAYIKLRWEADVYFEPLCERYNYKNLPKIIAKHMVKGGKGKKGLGLEKMGNVLSIRKTVERGREGGQEENE